MSEDVKRTANRITDADHAAFLIADRMISNVENDVEILLLKTGLRARISQTLAHRQALLEKFEAEYIDVTHGERANLDISTGEITRTRPPLAAVPDGERSA